VAAKTVSACLLGKMSKLVDGHRQAAKRLAWAKDENERKVRMRGEKLPEGEHWAANVYGKGVHRTGQFVIPC
jgi:hypothetical protein